MYRAMLDHFGPQGWWPGDGPLEIMIGAVLTQNTNWANVKRAIVNLREHGLIDIEKLVAIDPGDLAELIRPAGYFKLKAKRLKNVMNFLWREYEGDLDSLFQLPVCDLRDQLISVNGIGPETADDIVLYAGEKPTFVVDAYTYRIMVRHKLIGEEDDYLAIKEFFESNLPEDVELFKEYHALIVAAGKSFCRKALGATPAHLNGLITTPSCPLCSWRLRKQLRWHNGTGQGDV